MDLHEDLMRLLRTGVGVWRMKGCGKVRAHGPAREPDAPGVNVWGCGMKGVERCDIVDLHKVWRLPTALCVLFPFTGRFTLRSASSGRCWRLRLHIAHRHLLIILRCCSASSTFKQIHAEVSEFWSVLEAAAAQRHRQLLRRVNGALHVVTARVEALVSERLQVRGALVSVQLHVGRRYVVVHVQFGICFASEGLLGFERLRLRGRMQVGTWVLVTGELRSGSGF